MAEHLDPMEIPCILCGAENKQEVTVPLSLCEEHEDADVNARVPCLQRELQQAQQDLAKERENGLREANACEQARLAALRAHDDLAEAQTERDAAIEREGEQRRRRIEAEALVDRIDKIIAAPNERPAATKGYLAWAGLLTDVRLEIHKARKSAHAEAQGRQAR